MEIDIEFSGVNFFKASPTGGVVIDWEVVDSLTPYRLVFLSPDEFEFYNYVKKLREDPNFRGLHFSGKGGPGIGDEILDAPHSALCGEFLRVIRSPNVDDSELS